MTMMCGRAFPEFGVFQKDIKCGGHRDKKSGYSFAEPATDNIEPEKPPQGSQEQVRKTGLLSPERQLARRDFCQAIEGAEMVMDIIVGVMV
jgi:hypothetical protein